MLFVHLCNFLKVCYHLDLMEEFFWGKICVSKEKKIQNKNKSQVSRLQKGEALSVNKY